MQQTFNDLSVTSGVNVKLDVGDSDKDLHVHVTLNEKRWWSGGVQGFMGNDPDAKVGLGGGVVRFHSMFYQSSFFLTSSSRFLLVL